MSTSAKPRIALAIHALFGGGAERLMSQLANRWSVDNEIHLITWSRIETDGYQVSATVRRHGLSLQRPSTGPVNALFANISRVRRLRTTLRSIQPRLLLSFSDQMNIVALEAVRRTGIPCIIAEHSDPQQQQLGRVWEAWRRRNYPTCTSCVALTQDIAHYLEQFIAPERLQVIPPAIATPVVYSSLPHTSDDPKRIRFVGRLSKEKGVDVLLHAWKLLQAKLPDWRLEIVGDGADKTRLQHMAATLERVEFLGWLESPWTAVVEASLFVLPSRYEGFPVALLEAMSHGLACVVTDCSSAIHQLNAAGDVLYVVDREAPEQLSQALWELAQNSSRRQSMADKSREVAAAYTWDHVGRQWDELLDQTLRRSI